MLYGLVLEILCKVQFILCYQGRFIIFDHNIIQSFVHHMISREPIEHNLIGYIFVEGCILFD